MYEITLEDLARFYFYLLLSSRQLSKQRVCLEGPRVALTSRTR